MPNHLLSTLASDYNWHAVSLLKGTIERQEDGTKTIPVFKEGYRDKALAKKKTLFTMVNPHLVLTGKDSNVVAIDCDNKVTADILTALDPTNKWLIKPVGKEGLTLLYQYDNSMHSSFSTKTAPLELDFLATGRGFYFPDKVNKTKETWTEIPPGPIPVMPEAVKSYLKNFVSTQNFKNFDANNLKQPTADYSKLSYAALEPLITLACADAKLSANALKILTPNKFKKSLANIFDSKGYIHPADIQKGSSSIYLLAISTIIGGDESVNPKLYKRAINLFNSLLPNPLDETRLSKTIINPMLNGKSAVDDVVIWRYDKDWKNKGLTLVNKDGELLNLLVNKTTKEVLELNTITQHVYVYESTHRAVAGLNLTTVTTLKADMLNTRARLYNVVYDFTKPFGIIDGFNLNMNKISEPLEILKNPEVYKLKHSHINKPVETLKFFEHLIPDYADRLFFLRFIKTKLTTFKLSPIVFSFTGVPGSGKDVMFELISQLVGKQNTTKPNPKVFISNFNDWAENKLFGLLNEYGDSLTKRYQFDEVKGKLKDITGSPKFLLESKNKSTREAEHCITLIMCQNKASPLQDVNDRRFYFIDTPNILLESTLFNDSRPGAFDAIDKLVAKMHKELPEFAYYLATELEILDAAAYAKPKQTSAANISGYEGINDTSSRLAQVILKKDWDYLSQQIDAMDNYEITDNDVRLFKRDQIALDLCKELLSYWGYLPSTQQINLGLRNIKIGHASQGSASVNRAYKFNIPGVSALVKLLGLTEEVNEFEEYEVEDNIPLE